MPIYMRFSGSFSSWLLKTLNHDLTCCCQQFSKPSWVSTAGGGGLCLCALLTVTWDYYPLWTALNFQVQSFNHTAYELRLQVWNVILTRVHLPPTEPTSGCVVLTLFALPAETVSGALVLFVLFGILHCVIQPWGTLSIKTTVMNHRNWNVELTEQNWLWNFNFFQNYFFIVW